MKPRCLIYILILVVSFLSHGICKVSNDTFYTVVLDPSKSFCSQVKKAKTRYIVQSKFDLCGETVSMPQNSILEFNGGFLYNGELLGKNTLIVSKANQVFDTTIVLSGDWTGVELLPEWFGAKGDGLEDDTKAVQCAIDNGSVVVLSSTYKVKHLNINKSLLLKGGCLKAFLDEYGSTRNILTSKGKYNLTFRQVKFDGSGSKLADKGKLEPMISINGSKKVVFEKCVFHHHSQNSGLPDEIEWQKRRCYALSILGANKVVLNGCDFHNNLSEQIAIGSNTTKKSCKPFTTLEIKNCTSHDNERALALFLLFELKSASIHDNFFKDNGRTFFNLVTANVTFAHNQMINTGSRAITSEADGNDYSADNITIEDNVIINAREGSISIGNNNIRIVNNTIKNDFFTGKNDYMIRLGGVITGDNSVSKECRSSLPFYDNSYSKNKKKRNIHIENNEIKGFAQRSVIGVRPTENLSTELKTNFLGHVSNIIVKNNVIKAVGNSNAIYFPNGSYSGIVIKNNQITMSSSKPAVYMSPSYYSHLGRSYFKGFEFSNNTVVYTDRTRVEYVIQIGDGIVKSCEIKGNRVNDIMENDICNFE